MNANGFSRALSALLLGLALGQPALAQQDEPQQDKARAEGEQPAPAKAPVRPSEAAGSVEAMTARYPRGAINSDEMAEQAQVDVQSLQAVLGARLAQAQYACYDRFFTNHCIDKAKEAYRADMAALRPIELEAGAFQRQARVDRRDQALEARRKEEEAEAPDRMRVAQENEQKAAQKAQARTQQEIERQQRQTLDAANESKAGERIQRHEEKMQRLREDDARKERERAGNIAAYERKQREAAERQKKVAEKKAEKQAKQAAKSGQPAVPAASSPAGAAR